MKRIAVSLILLPMFVSTAGAEQLYRFDQHVIERAVQCEFGRAADSVYIVAPQRKMLVGKVHWTRDEYTTKSAEGVVAFLAKIFTGTVSYTDEYSIGYGATTYQNLHRDNIAACHDINKVNLAIDQCLITQAEYLKVEGQTVTCQATATGTSSLKAGVGGDVWLVNVSTTGGYSKKWVYTIDILMPSEPPTSPPPLVASAPAPSVQQAVLHSHAGSKSIASRGTRLVYAAFSAPTPSVQGVLRRHAKSKSIASRGTRLTHTAFAE